MEDSALTGAFREYMLIVGFGQLIMQHTHPLHCNVEEEEDAKTFHRESRNYLTMRCHCATMYPLNRIQFQIRQIKWVSMKLKY